jgi:hypothetical protein
MHLFFSMSPMRGPEQGTTRSIPQLLFMSFGEFWFAGDSWLHP